MMKNVTLQLPHGSARIIYAREFVSTYIARMETDEGIMYVPTLSTDFLGVMGPLLSHPQPENVERREYLLMPAKDQQAIQNLALGQFNTLVAKKPIEFSIPHLTIEALIELSVKFQMNFGSGNFVIVLAHLNKYLKVAAIIDSDAFRLCVNSRTGCAALAEMYPTKWVVGKYESEDQMFQKMFDNRQYRA